MIFKAIRYKGLNKCSCTILLVNAYTVSNISFFLSNRPVKFNIDSPSVSKSFFNFREDQYLWAINDLFVFLDLIKLYK